MRADVSISAPSGIAPGAGAARRVVSLGVLAVMCYLGVAGIAKLLDVSGFVAALRTWTLLPGWSREPLSILVPATEVLLGGLWVLGFRTRRVLVAAALLLALFSGTLAIQTVMAKEPTCGCLGALERFRLTRFSATQHVLLNAGFIGVLGLGLVTASPPRRRALSIPARDASHGSRAFTLVELLVCISIIGVVLALTVPGMVRSRGSAVQAGALTKMRHHAAVFAAYTSDYHDSFPLYTNPAGPAFIGEPPRQVQVGYFGGYTLWPWALANTYYNAHPNSDVFTAPQTREGAYNSFCYANCFLAAPEFWNEFTRTGPSQWRATRMGEVEYPASKGLFITIWPILREPRVPEARWLMGVACVDTSARAIRHDRLAPPYPFGEGAWDGSELGAPGRAVMHTRDGLRGRDIE